MGKLVDLTGQRFGRLVVVERAGSDIRKQAMWKCRCDCGNVKILCGKDIREGKTLSCGCLCREKSSLRAKERNFKHGARDTRIYTIYTSMKQRCHNKENKDYANYGGRGITVCSEWMNDFSAFQYWAQTHGYCDSLTIDRIDNDKGYSPDNCRWATHSEQRKNQRPHKHKTK